MPCADWLSVTGNPPCPDGRTILLALTISTTFMAQSPTKEPDRTSQVPFVVMPFDKDLGLYPNEPIYIALGNREGLDARFQLSLNYRITKPSSCAAPLHVTFTTASLWDLHSSSKPFRDSSYRPGLAWTWTFPSPAFALDTGWEHESNGRGPDPDRPLDAGNNDDLSRSMNRFYMKGYFTWFGGRLLFAPKVVWNYDKASQNADMDRYRGYCDWLVKWESQPKIGYVASLFFRQGTDAEHRFLQVDVGVPCGALVSGANGWILIQYLNGYGQTLRDYNIKTPGTLRIGYMIVP